MKNIKHSDNVLSADNQQERLKHINPWYIVGFTEGEGTFHVAFYKDPQMKQGIKVIPEFHINQSYLRLEILETIKKYFDCGYLKQNHVKNKKDDTYVFVVRNRDDLIDKIIPFFEKYNFISDKQKSFTIFKQIVFLMQSGAHSNRAGIKKIINLAYKMNVNGKYRKTKKQDLYL